MSKALPDDEAIEAKMVTKAIERAQTTVETRNAEIRKNVLKYDEVMNEQRKVIYRAVTRSSRAPTSSRRRWSTSPRPSTPCSRRTAPAPPTTSGTSTGWPRS